MKDVPHHMMKFMRKIVKKSGNADEKDEDKYSEEEILKEKSVPPSKKQQRKQKKEAIKKARENHIPSDLTPDEKNKELKKRTPIIRERSNQSRNQSIR